MSDERRPATAGQRTPAGPRAPARRDPEEVRRHEAHLVAQIYHLIQANAKLEEQIDRLARVTEIADIFRQRKITRDTFELRPPLVVQAPEAAAAWSRIEAALAEMPEGTPGLGELRNALGMIRAATPSVESDWLSEVRVRLVAAEQAIAFLDEQTRELDLLRDEKNNIMDGVGRLEQTIEDLWKSLNEKTTHIQGLEVQLERIWNSLPYRVLKVLRRPWRRGERA